MVGTSQLTQGIVTKCVRSDVSYAYFKEKNKGHIGYFEWTCNNLFLEPGDGICIDGKNVPNNNYFILEKVGYQLTKSPNISLINAMLSLTTEDMIFLKLLDYFGVIFIFGAKYKASEQWFFIVLLPLILYLKNF